VSQQRIMKIVRGKTRTTVEWAEGKDFIWHHRVIIQRTNDGYFQVVSFMKRDHDKRFKQESCVSIPDEALGATLFALGASETIVQPKKLPKVRVCVKCGAPDGTSGDCPAGVDGDYRGPFRLRHEFRPA
jgi:hypothetical protein